MLGTLGWFFAALVCVKAEAVSLELESGSEDAEKKPSLDFMFCEDVADGFYKDPERNCSGRFFACVGAEPKEFHCPDGTVYDQAARKCDSRMFVAGCPGAVTTAAPNVTTTEALSADEAATAVTLPPFDCAARPQGFYQDPRADHCSHVFFACVPGLRLGLPRTCPGHLKYEPKLNQCLPSRQVEACGGTLPATTPTPNATEKSALFASGNGAVFMAPAKKVAAKKFDTKLAKETPSKPKLQDAPPKVPAEDAVKGTQVYLCRGKVGRFGVPHQHCSQSFLVCTPKANTAEPMTCPDDLFWHRRRKACVAEHTVKACRKAPPPKGSQGAPKAPSETAAPVKKVAAEAKVKPGDMDCGRRPQGTYGDPVAACSQRFFICGPNSRATAMSCPPHLHYDRQFHQCLPKAHIPQCNGSRPEKAQGDGEEQKGGQSDEVDFDCAGKADGNYAVAGLVCPHTFVTCANQTAFLASCPGNLRYHSARNQCLHRDNVSSCDGVPVRPY